MPRRSPYVTRPGWGRSAASVRKRERDRKRRWLADQAIWTPAALFAQGQQGVWYEPKPEYLFQDAAGTIPVTADGDPVGRMLDLSPNGNHATQETSASRPVYRTDGVLHWLEPDRVDDFMLFPAFTPPADCIVFAGIQASAAPETEMWIGRLGGSQPGAKIGYTDALYFGRLSDAGAGQSISATTAGNGVVIGIERDSDNLVTFSAGVQVVSDGDANPVYLDSLFRARFGAVQGQHFGGRFFGAVLVDSNEGSPGARSYLANLAGVTL